MKSESYSDLNDNASSLKGYESKYATMPEAKPKSFPNNKKLPQKIKLHIHQSNPPSVKDIQTNSLEEPTCWNADSEPKDKWEV